MIEVLEHRIDMLGKRIDLILARLEKLQNG